MSSDIALLKHNIAQEYAAAQLGLSGLATGVSRHQWISSRQERLGVLHQELQEQIGAHAIMIVADILNQVPDHPSRQQVQQVLRYALGNTEGTARLLREIEAFWRQFDLLSEQIGIEAVRTLMDASSPPQESVIPS